MKKRRSIMALFCAITLGVTLLATPAPANAATYWVIKNYGLNMCIDNPNFSQANNTKMDIWKCVGPPRQTNEQWEWKPIDASEWTIKNRSSGKCLTMQNGDTGDNVPVIQYDCFSQTHARWYQVPTGIQDISGYDYYEIRSVKNNKCITVQNRGTTNGSKLIMFTCNGGTNQWWTWLA
jgi:alpha-galactosidase